MLIQLTTSFWAQLSMSYFTLFLWSSFRKWVLAKSSIGLGSLPRTISCKKKLLVKHSYIKEFFIKKIYVIKKKSYHPLHMQNEWNGSTNMHHYWTMNHLVLILHSGLRPPHETFRHYVLDISFSNSLYDVWRFEIPLNDHIFPA
jgi:hypothetical protein